MGLVHVGALPVRACFDLKGTKEIVESVLENAPLPSKPNTRSENNGFEIHWIGTENWMLTAPLESENEWIRRFSEFSANPELLVLTVSDLFSFVEISGEGGADVLASAVSVDFLGLGADSSLFTEVFGQKALLVKRTHCHEIAIENSLTEFLLIKLRIAAGLALPS